MSRNLTPAIAMALVAALVPSSGYAQQTATAYSSQHDNHFHLHVNPKWSDCAFQLDPSLTQAAWRQFTREAGLVTYFRPLSDARPMGAGKFEISLLQWQTSIDDHDSAWNDTFVHPDSTHWLTEGSGLAFPGFLVQRGMTSKLDLGVYFAKNPKSNYGVSGAQVQYNVVNDTAANWAASTRLSFSSLFGPSDLNLAVVGADLLASKTYRATRWASVSPYAGVSAYLARSHEKTSVVSLDDESVVGGRATVGVMARVSVATLAWEYTAARVSSRSIKLGVAF